MRTGKHQLPHVHAKISSLRIVRLFGCILLRETDSVCNGSFGRVGEVCLLISVVQLSENYFYGYMSLHLPTSAAPRIVSISVGAFSGTSIG